MNSYENDKVKIIFSNKGGRIKEVLLKEYYKVKFDEENLRLVGKRTGKEYNLGDPIEVIVAGVDSDEGRIDFLMDGSYVPPTPKVKETKSAGSNNRSRKKKAKSPSPRLSLKTNSRGLRKARVSKSRRKSKTR